MRNLRSSLTALRPRALRGGVVMFAAALYVLLGISASWHAPHFSRGEVAVGVDAHAAEHEKSPGDGDCALCTWKTAAQESFVPVAVAPVAHSAAAAQRPEAKVPAGGLLRADRARAPPILS
jgi:hypothetical protein